MKLWQRAAGALKDRSSIFVANLSRRTSVRIANLEEAIIKATSHDSARVDYRNVNRVFAWVRASPVSLKPLIWALSNRMDKTQSWVVALKGLMLMHGVFYCKTAAVNRIGRLPFDLSNFVDKHSSPRKTWGFEEFVRAYYVFLDQRSVVFHEKTKPSERPLMQELIRLQRWQSLLELLMKIKPQARNMRVTLILEAMDCVIIELCEVYSRICNGIARVLINIYSANKVEAELALKVVHKATILGQQLSMYFELSRDFGVVNATDCPKVKQIPEEDIKELERIINGVSVSDNQSIVDDKKAIVVRENNLEIVEKQKNGMLKTTITSQWEVFDEEFSRKSKNPFEYSPPNNLFLLPLITIDDDDHVYVTAPTNYCKQELPDLISF